MCSKALAAVGAPASRLARTRAGHVKGRLRANTGEAVARGAFGAPAIFVGDELFWGNDRLDHLAALLDGKLPATPGKASR